MKTLLHACFFLTISSQQLFAQLYDGFTDFDQNNQLYLTIGATPGNLWQIAIPSKPYLNAAYSVPRVIITDSINPYPVNDTSVFQILLPFSFVGYGSELRFHHRYETTAGHDGGYVEFSHDLGQTWFNVIADSDYLAEGGNIDLYNFYDAADTLEDGTPAFSGSSSTWQESYINFGFLCVSPVRMADTILVRFVFKSDSIADNLDGWMIDDINVVEYVCSDIANLSNSIFDFTLFPNPAGDAVSVLFNKPTVDEVSLQIKDMMGRSWNHADLSPGQKEYNINVTNLPSGLYEMVVYSGNHFYTRKLIKD